MNEEKELLVQKCCDNPVLQTVTTWISSLGNAGDWVRIRIVDLGRETGLSDRQIRTAIAWLERKGFLASSFATPYAPRDRRYLLDLDVHGVTSGLKVRRFGEIGESILGSFVTGKRQVKILSFEDNCEIGDEYGVPLSAAEVRGLLATLTAHMELAQSFGEIEWENHRQSRSNLLPWSGSYGSRMHGGKPSALLCSCTKCKNDYESALTAWTNFRSYQKQEKKTVKDAVKELV